MVRRVGKEETHRMIGCHDVAANSVDVIIDYRYYIPSIIRFTYMMRYSEGILFSIISLRYAVF